MRQMINLTVNGRGYQLEVESDLTLLTLLREKLGLTGTKQGCDGGECGSCTVLINGEAILSCLTLALDVAGKEITTIEGLAVDGQLDPLQQAFMTEGAIQCGFCTPGMIMSAKALLNRNPHPTVAEIKESMAGNICRCTGYQKIIKAVETASATDLGGT